MVHGFPKALVYLLGTHGFPEFFVLFEGFLFIHILQGIPELLVLGNRVGAFVARNPFLILPL
jgi:hypothetical protein